MEYKSTKLGVILYDSRDCLHDIQSILRNHNKSIFKDVCQALRIAITGSTISPPIFEVMEILGRDETIKRLGNACE